MKIEFCQGTNYDEITNVLAEVRGLGYKITLRVTTYTNGQPQPYFNCEKIIGVKK